MDRTAYLLALTAIGLWSALASAATLLAGRDPLVVTGLGLCGGGLIGAWRWRSWGVGLPTFLVGVGGILGYHLLYFAAFAHAPAVEVNLINYLWPLLIVVLAPLVVGGGLGRLQVIAAVLGLVGTAVLCLGDGLRGGGGIGYALAGAAAVVWALYSLLTRGLPPFPTAAVGGFCLASGFGALGVAALRGNLAAELAAFDAGQWVLLAALGIGPLGAAFFCWDAALKRGDPRVIGNLAYLTPLLSTLWLVLLTGGRFGWHSAAALALIMGGAVLGSRSARTA
jgi:drug/metabolite transporter (DMT)-like permease